MIGCQPGRLAIPSQGFQSRNGKDRWPVKIDRRAGTVGMASGSTRSKRMLCRARASMLGVRTVRLP